MQRKPPVADPAKYVSDIRQAARAFSQALEEHGDSPESAKYLDRRSQERRMDILCEVGPVAEAKILDFGCATGHLLTYLRDHHGYTGEYVGYDIAEPMIATARQKFGESARFECRNILEEGIPEQFDYVLVAGTFNYLTGRNWELMQDILRTLYGATEKALAFNNLSTYVDYFDDGLFYIAPERVLSFCKEELSTCVTLRHDYWVKENVLPYEFTTYVYRSAFDPRKNLQPSKSP